MIRLTVSGSVALSSFLRAETRARILSLLGLVKLAIEFASRRPKAHHKGLLMSDSIGILAQHAESMRFERISF